MLKIGKFYVLALYIYWYFILYGYCSNKKMILIYFYFDGVMAIRSCSPDSWRSKQSNAILVFVRLIFQQAVDGWQDKNLKR